MLVFDTLLRLPFVARALSLVVPRLCCVMAASRDTDTRRAARMGRLLSPFSIRIVTVKLVGLRKIVVHVRPKEE